MNSWFAMDVVKPTHKHGSVLLYASGTYYIGQLRYGYTGEPQPGVNAWRCDSSGRFSTPTHWMPLPHKPTDKQTIKAVLVKLPARDVTYD